MLNKDNRRLCSKCVPMWLESQTDKAHVSEIIIIFSILWPTLQDCDVLTLA
jgi:hypothetical protein